MTQSFHQETILRFKNELRGFYLTLSVLLFADVVFVVVVLVFVVVVVIVIYKGMW